MLQRLRQEDNDGLVAGMALVDSMWRDLEPRFKIVGVCKKKYFIDSFLYEKLMLM